MAIQPNLQGSFTIEEGANGNSVFKAFDPNISGKSVVSTPGVEERSLPLSDVILQFAHTADEFSPWGKSIKSRDRQLREFWTTENLLASAVYSVVIRNASFKWRVVNKDKSLKPHKNTINAATRMLKNSDRGKGWSYFIKKVCIDLYTQDNGAFIEIIRAKDSPNSAVINIAHLDSWRCTRTGDPETPVIYTDRDGVDHEMKWYQVATLEELPSAVESLYGVQVCAVSRALRAAQIMRDIALYKHEKISGRNPSAMHIISGVSQSSLEAVKQRHEESLMNMGLIRYAPPVMLSTIDPTSAVNHVQVDLASLPDNYNEQTSYQWYIAQLAAAFGVDYQEFAPLPTSQNLGSSQQSEVLHMKTRGKGPAAIMELIEHLINGSGILPKTVEFEFIVQDLRAETEQAEARFARGKDRTLRLERKEIDDEAAIELAVLDGDLPEFVAEPLLKRMKERRELGLDIATGRPLEQRGTIPANQPNSEEDRRNEDGKKPEISANQVGAGSQSNEKAADIDRAERARILRQSGDVDIDLPEITEDDIAKQKLLLGRKLVSAPENQAKIRLMGPVLEGEINRWFTLMVDEWYQNGKLTRPERIELTSIIGDVLDLLHNRLPDDIASRPEHVQEFIGEFQEDAVNRINAY